MVSDLYGEIRAAGWSMRNTRVWKVGKLDAAAARLIAAAVGLYLVGERRRDVRRAVSVATGYGLGYGVVLRRLS